MATTYPSEGRCKLSLPSTYLYGIFSEGVFTPPPWTKHTGSSQNPIATSTLQWQPAHWSSLLQALSNLEDSLRAIHKRKIVRPIAGNTSLISQSPKEYMMMLLCPISDIFNQLKLPDTLPMKCIDIAFDDELYGATFLVEGVEHWLSVHPPVVLCLPDDLFDTNGCLSSRAQYGLSKTLEYSPLTSSIIISNFREVAICLPPTTRCPEPTFEKVSTTDPSRALRVIVTAYLIMSLRPSRRYMNIPGLEAPVTQDMVGPWQSPNAPLLSDEQIFLTHHKHSDFDLITLVHDRARALQFFRWKDYVRQHTPKVVVQPRDVLNAVTNVLPHDAHPIYPYDASELPPDTLEHLSMIQRESSLAVAGIDNSLRESQIFALEIESVLSEGTKYGISTVYRCRITSIDNGPVLSSTPLCLKLFDDRLQSLDVPLENDDPGWITEVACAQTDALTEALAYEKLCPVQGSIVPWYYGMHQFTLPNGNILYGLLIEFVEGGDLRSEYVKNLSTEEKIQTIKSIRHGIRVLDVSDICQRDWCAGQIMVHTTPAQKLTHVVLIDFASTTQTWDPDQPILLDNHSPIFLMLIRWARSVGFAQGLIWEHFDEPDEWDPVSVSLDHTKRRLEARTLFPFIITPKPPPIPFPPLRKKENAIR
ncbi:hypothetical protein BDN70DRAFT_989108, partial [Pholiota conissans]